MDDDAQFCSAILQRVPGAEEALGLNAPLLALALLASPHPILSSLSTHRERLGPAELALLTRVAELSGIAPDDLLACAANAFVITDEATATRRVAHGLFPAAAMLSHSCVPAAENTRVMRRFLASCWPSVLASSFRTGTTTRHGSGQKSSSHQTPMYPRGYQRKLKMRLTR